MKTKEVKVLGNWFPRRRWIASGDKHIPIQEMATAHLEAASEFLRLKAGHEKPILINANDRSAIASIQSGAIKTWDVYPIAADMQIEIRDRKIAQLEDKVENAFAEFKHQCSERAKQRSEIERLRRAHHEVYMDREAHKVQVEHMGNQIAALKKELREWNSMGVSTMEYTKKCYELNAANHEIARLKHELSTREKCIERIQHAIDDHS